MNGQILESKGGWSGTYNPRTTRRYAVMVNGDFLRDKAGARRTFKTKEAAQKALVEATK